MIFFEKWSGEWNWRIEGEVSCVVIYQLRCMFSGSCLCNCVVVGYPIGFDLGKVLFVMNA